MLRGPGGFAGRVVLSPATQHEVGDLLGLRDALARWLADRGIEQWQVGEFDVGRLAAWIEAGRVHILRRDGRIAAAVAVLWDDPDIWGSDPAAAGYVHLLMVDRAHAGHGLGDAVLAWCEAHILEHGRSLARLDAAADNHRLQGWYAARGYTEVGHRTFRDGARFTVTLREKPLQI